MATAGSFASHPSRARFDTTRWSLAARAGGEVFMAVHRVRRRFRACVREQVEMTVLDPAEAAAEVKHLLGI